MPQHNPPTTGDTPAAGSATETDTTAATAPPGTQPGIPGAAPSRVTTGPGTRARITSPPPTTRPEVRMGSAPEASGRSDTAAGSSHTARPDSPAGSAAPEPVHTDTPVNTAATQRPTRSDTADGPIASTETSLPVAGARANTARRSAARAEGKAAAGSGLPRTVRPPRRVGGATVAAQDAAGRTPPDSTDAVAEGKAVPSGIPERTGWARRVAQPAGGAMAVERLRVLRELADRGTVAAVAAALSMTPSAVSQQLKVLAREAGVVLLEPDGRRVRLTDAGRALVVRADEVLAAMDRAVAEMESYRGSPRGQVRVALFPSGAALLLPRVLRELAGSGVDVVAADEDLPPSEVLRLLADYDVVLTHRDEHAPSVAGPRVDSRVLMREPIDVLVAPEHRLARSGAVVPAELADEEWLSVRGGFPVDDVLRSIATVTGVQPRITQRLNDFSVIEAMVAADCGIALMPRFAVRDPNLVMLRLAGVRAARLYDLATRPHADRRPAVAAVLAAFRTAAQQATATDRPR